VVAPRPAGARLPGEIRVLVAASFLIALGYGLVAPALPLFAVELGAGATAAAVVVAAFAVARVLFAPFSGLLVRSGVLRVFCAGLLVVGGSSAACAYAADYPQLLAFRAAGGIGSTMFTVAAAALIIRLAPPRMRGRASAAWSSAFLLGTVAGPVIGGGLLTVDVRAPFLAYAVVLGIAAALAGAALRGRFPPPTDGTGAAVRVGFGEAARHRAFRAALGSNVVNGWTVYGVRVALVPLYVDQVLRGSAQWAGVVLAAFGAGTVIALPLGGRLADRWGRRPSALAGSVLVAATTGVLGFASTAWALVVASLVSGAGTGLMTPSVSAVVGDVVAGADNRADGGPALAGFQMVGDVGAVVGPVLAGLLAEHGGYPAAFGMTAAVVAVSGLGWLRAPETRPRTNES
jgi:MFS family permease